MPLSRTYTYQQSVARNAKIFGLNSLQGTSNLLTPTRKRWVSDSGSPFLKQTGLSVSVNSASKKRLRTPKLSNSGYPYHPAMLTPDDYDITKPWYITFYAWDIGKEALVRKRVMKDELRAITDLERRKAFARQVMDQINEFLQDDYHLDSAPAPKILAMDFRGYSLMDAITYAINYKREIAGIKKSSLKKYDSALTTVKDFLKHKGLPERYPLAKVNAQFIEAYFEYLKIERKIGNKTHNDRRGFLHAMFAVLIKKSNNALFRGVNPVAAVSILQEVTKKHAAFSTDQLQSIITYARARQDHHVVLFIQLLYYTLARPEELRLLRVGNIDLERRRILFKGDEAKTSIEAYVGINDRLYDILIESGVSQFPPHYYLFSNALVSDRSMIDDSARRNAGRADARSYAPGETPVGVNYFYEMISCYMEALDLYKVNPNFTPYGIKHTGAIGLYLATKDPAVVQSQCRHQKLETTLKYLRDLGIFIDFTQINKWNAV
jgi:integrase